MSHQLEANKAAVRDFYNLAFNLKKPEEAVAKHMGSSYRQHNPGAGDGPAPFIGFVRGFAQAFPALRVDLKRQIAEIQRVAVWSALVFAAAVVLGVSASVTPAINAQRQVTPPAPVCTPGAALTPSQTEGPFYKANTPQRTSLIEQGMAGTRVIVTGYVLGRDCRPIPRAWLDFWQADDKGEYDNTGFRLRGHQFADNAGIYYLETVLPGLYPGRTRHIHVKVRASNGPILTSQLYFPGEARNQNDGIFNQRLIVSMQDGAGGKAAFYNFVIDTR